MIFMDYIKWEGYKNKRLGVIPTTNPLTLNLIP